MHGFYSLASKLYISCFWNLAQAFKFFVVIAELQKVQFRSQAGWLACRNAVLSAKKPVVSM